jgi:amphi-Trp domain-containing protein
MRKPRRDLEKHYGVNEFVSKLRRLADALESGKRFHIQIAGERIYVPVGATFNIEHERGEDGEEVEFQIKWKPS